VQQPAQATYMDGSQPPVGADGIPILQAQQPQQQVAQLPPGAPTLDPQQLAAYQAWQASQAAPQPAQ
jgi:hypothetical protein